MASGIQSIPAHGKHVRLLIMQGTISGVHVRTVMQGRNILMEPLFDEIHRQYPRANVGGSRGMERLVLINYEILIDRVRDVIREKLGNGDLDWSRNTIRDIRNACLELDGLHPRDFTKKDGSPMQRNRAFGEMVKQFFLDETLIKGLFREVKEEMRGAIFRV